MRLECSATVRFPIHLVSKFMSPPPKKKVDSIPRCMCPKVFQFRIGSRKLGFPVGRFPEFVHPKCVFCVGFKLGWKILQKPMNFYFVLRACFTMRRGRGCAERLRQLRGSDDSETRVPFFLLGGSFFKFMHRKSQRFLWTIGIIALRHSAFRV